MQQSQSQSIALNLACVQWPAVTTVARTPFRPAAVHCTVEHSDEYLCTGGAYRRHYSGVSKQAGAFLVHSTFLTCSFTVTCPVQVQVVNSFSSRY